MRTGATFSLVSGFVHVWRYLWGKECRLLCILYLLCDTSNEQYILLWKFIGNYMKEVIFVNVLQVRGRCLILSYWHLYPCQQWFIHTHKQITYTRLTLLKRMTSWQSRNSLTVAWTAPGDIICISSLLYSFCNYL